MTDQPTIGHNNPPPDYLMWEMTERLFEGLGDNITVAEFISECPDLDTLPAAKIAHLFAHVKGEYDKLEAMRKELSKFVELIKNVKLPAAFDRDEVKTFTLQDGTRVTKSERVTASIIGSQEEAFNWLRTTGKNPDIIKETVNASSLAAYANAVTKNVMVDPETGMMKAKDADLPIDLPADIFKVTVLPTTSITKGKAK